MKKYQFIFIVVVVLLYLLNSYYDYEEIRRTRKAFLSDLNITIVDLPKRLAFDNTLLVDANFTFWDMTESDILKKRKAKDLLLKEKANENSVTKKENSFNLKKRIICLEKQCWEFLGVVTINDKSVVTLLSKENKLETFHVGDQLLENLTIVEITSEKMLLNNLKKKKKFELKLFDVDMEQYLPKSKKKERNE